VLEQREKTVSRTTIRLDVVPVASAAEECVLKIYGLKRLVRAVRGAGGGLCTASHRCNRVHVQARQRRNGNVSDHRHVLQSTLRPVRTANMGVTVPSTPRRGTTPPGGLEYEGVSSRKKRKLGPNILRLGSAHWLLSKISRHGSKPSGPIPRQHVSARVRKATCGCTRLRYKLWHS
jgi:hypothetical protein